VATNNTSNLNTPARSDPGDIISEVGTDEPTFDHTKHRSSASDHMAKIMFERLMKK
jgi:hypothetical protein